MRAKESSLLFSVDGGERAIGTLLLTHVLDGASVWEIRMLFHSHLAKRIFPAFQRHCLPTVLLAWVWLAPALADTISFTGNLRTDATFLSCGPGCTLGSGNTDADFAQWAAVGREFNVNVTSVVQAITFSYGGGTNAAGAAIPQGSFRPYLSLFDKSGDFLTSTFSGTTCPPGAHKNTNSQRCFDVRLDSLTLAPGKYEIAISAFENVSFAENLIVGESGFDGQGTLHPGEDLNYAFDVILTPQAGTSPESSTAWLCLTVLPALYFSRGRRKRRSHDEKAR
jgi:hypothetical protein